MAGAVKRFRVQEPGVWLELVLHRPQVECQVQAAAAMALTRSEDIFAEIGMTDLSVNELGSMCVHVCLEDDIVQRLPGR